MTSGQYESVGSSLAMWGFTTGVGFSCLQERELAKEMFASAAGQEILHQASKRSNT